MRPSSEASESDVAEWLGGELRKRIVSGEYQPGAKLTAEQVARDFDVSRTPVREALVRLAGDGFVQYVRNRGAFVARWSMEDVEEIFGLRIALESMGAGAAADREGDQQAIAELADLADRMDASLKAAAPDYVEECAQLNTAFHLALVGASANKRLSAIVGNLIKQPVVVRTIAVQDRGELAGSFAQHHELITALERGESDWAEALMRAHIIAGRDAMRRAFAAGDLEPLVGSKRTEMPPSRTEARASGSDGTGTRQRNPRIVIRDY